MKFTRAPNSSPLSIIVNVNQSTCLISYNFYNLLTVENAIETAHNRATIVVINWIICIKDVKLPSIMTHEYDYIEAYWCWWWNNYMNLYSYNFNDDCKCCFNVPSHLFQIGWLHSQALFNQTKGFFLWFFHTNCKRGSKQRLNWIKVRRSV